MRNSMTCILQNKWMSTGLWSVVRHPNYAAEITMWFALFLTASSSFHSPNDYLTVLGPIFNAVLITKISGIPMVQARGDKLWGHLPEYQRYLQQTKRLIPGVW
jgi:steroid 5-alpha reductase family enzyme